MKFTKFLMLFVCALCFGMFSANFQSVAAQTEGDVRTADGVTLHYKTFGQGTPVLILSGNPGVTADYMLPVASELGKTNQAILLHPRGTAALPQIRARRCRSEFIVAGFRPVED